MEEDLPTTRRLLRRAREGDGEALNDLLGRMRPRLMVWVGARLGPLLKSRVEAEDIVQEILLAGYGALPSYEDRGHKQFYGWLFKIAEHCITAESDRHRAAKRDPRREAELSSRIHDAQTSPSMKAARREEWQIMLDVLPELQERYRAIFRLRRIEFKTNEEAAQILGITPNNASVLYVRAQRALRGKVAEARRRESGDGPEEQL